MKHLIMNASRWLAPALMSGLVLVGCGGTEYESKSFNVGGTVSGLNSGTSVQLTYGDAANTVTVAANGTFQFPKALPFNTAYATAVATQPTNQTCTVTNGSGNARAAVSNITVTCVTNGYKVGGTVSGLDASTQVTLKINDTETLVVSATGSDSQYSFSTPVTAYNVTVSQQPEGGYCSVSNASGTASANVTNVNVSCTQVTVLSCGAGKVLTGFSGRQGTIIDKIQIRCANVVGGVVDTASTTDGASVGGDGGAAFGPFTCPPGEWITGVKGGNGWVDSRASYPTSMRSVQGTCSGGSQSPPYNTGGLSAFSYSCPAGKKATGFIIEGVGAYTGFMEGMTCEP